MQLRSGGLSIMVLLQKKNAFENPSEDAWLPVVHYIFNNLSQPKTNVRLSTSHGDHSFVWDNIRAHANPL